jgi:hypothetical protein
MFDIQALVQGITLDHNGRVVLPDELVSEIEGDSNITSAGGPTNGGLCGNTSNTGCTNSASCSGSINRTSCTNHTLCGGTTNAGRCPAEVATIAE